MGDMADDAFDAMLDQMDLRCEEDEESVSYQVFVCRPTQYGRYPRSTSADAETRKLRQAAHLQLDCLWEFGGMTRSEAYVLVQRLMELPPEKAHIGLFNAFQCRTLIARLRTPTFHLLCS